MQYGVTVTAQTVSNRLGGHKRATRTMPTPDYVHVLLDAGNGSYISRPDYDRWREHNPSAPSAESIRRRYGTWNKALLAAGLEPRHVREYPGLTRLDAVLHIAHFLRATSARTKTAYRLWSKVNTDAPSVETLRNFGRWSELLEEATTVEARYRAQDVELPTPIPVGNKGRRKSPIRTVPL